MEEHGGSNSSVRGVVAVLDDGQEMDRCSCDLVKVSCVLNIYLGRHPLCENHASLHSVSPRNMFFQRGSPPPTSPQSQFDNLLPLPNLLPRFTSRVTCLISDLSVAPDDPQHNQANTIMPRVAFDPTLTLQPPPDVVRSGSARDSSVNFVVAAASPSVCATGRAVRCRLPRNTCTRDSSWCSSVRHYRG